MINSREGFKKKLLYEKERLMKELTELGVRNPRASADWIPIPEDVERFEADPNIVADQSENWAERRGTLDALETRFNNVTRALLKLEDGMYGTCEICTGNIEGDRLNVNPAARTCKKHLEDEVALSN